MSAVDVGRAQQKRRPAGRRFSLVQDRRRSGPPPAHEAQAPL